MTEVQKPDIKPVSDHSLVARPSATMTTDQEPGPTATNAGGKTGSKKTGNPPLALVPRHSASDLGKVFEHRRDHASGNSRESGVVLCEKLKRMMA